MDINKRNFFYRELLKMGAGPVDAQEYVDLINRYSYESLKRKWRFRLKNNL